MARRSPREVMARSQAAWQDKRQWYGLHYQCWSYAAPGLNPFEQGVVGEEGGGGNRGSVRGEPRHEHLFDSTLATSAQRLANRMVSEGFPDGVNWAVLEPGPLMRPGQDPQRPTDEDHDAIDLTEDRIFEAIHSANAGLALLQMVFDGVVSGTGLMKVGTARDSDTLLEFEAVNQAEVALEEGTRGSVRGIYRKMSYTREDIEALWPAATNLPEEEEREGQPVRHTVHDATYWDAGTGLWYYDVFVQTKGDGEPTRIYEQDYHVSPWVIWRYKQLIGEVQGRSPVMDALPDARVLNHAKRIRLESASVRSLGMYTYKVNSTAFNPRTIRLVSGAMLPVSSNDRSNPDVAPLELSGDVQLNELVIEALQESIRTTMLDFALPEPGGPVRSATEIIERQAEARQQRGQPFLRMMEEIGRPLLRLVAYLLQELGQLPELAQIRPVGEDTRRPIPLLLDGTDLVVQFSSPLAQSQSLSDARNVVQACETTLALTGPEVFQASVMTEELARELFPLFRAPLRLLRKPDLAGSMAEEARVAGLMGGFPQEQGGAPEGAAA